MNHQGKEQEEGSRGDGGKVEWKLSEVNTRSVSREQNVLIRGFKMAAGDVIIIEVGYELPIRNSKFSFHCLLLFFKSSMSCVHLPSPFTSAIFPSMTS